MKGRWLIPSLLGALAVSGCDCAAVGESKADLAILAFEVSESDPPGDPRGESLVVVPGAAITLAWGLEAEAERVILAADDEVLATWGRGEDPGHFLDACGAERCTTDQPGQVLYTLTAVFSEPEGAIDSRSLLVTISPTGLQILHLSVSPSRLSGRATAELSWSTSGAYLTEIYASPPGGGDRQRLGAFELPLAHEGRLEHEVEEALRFELVATAPDGSERSASTTITLDDQAYFTELSAAPAEVRPGETTTLSWKGVGLERLSILRDDGQPPLLGIAGAEALEGSREVEIHGPVRFRLVGTSDEGEPITELCDGTGCGPAEVEVKPPPRTRILSFRAEPASIVLGESSTLRFESVSADSLRLLWQEEGVTVEKELDPATEEYEVNPRSNTSFTLQAISQGRAASTAAVTVEVRPRAELYVATDPATGGVWAGEPTRVEWYTAGAHSIQLDLGGTPLDVAGLDPAADGLEVEVPDLPEGSRLYLVLTALGPHTLETATQVLVVHRRDAD